MIMKKIIKLLKSAEVIGEEEVIKEDKKKWNSLKEEEVNVEIKRMNLKMNSEDMSLIS